MWAILRIHVLVCFMHFLVNAEALQNRVRGHSIHAHEKRTHQIRNNHEKLTFPLNLLTLLKFYYGWHNRGIDFIFEVIYSYKHHIADQSS